MRREFSKAFKQDAISLVLDQGYTRVEAAKSLGIHSALLSRWVREYKMDDGDAFRGRGKLRAEQEEIRQLREEVKRLKMEKEILKKAAVDSIDQRNTYMKICVSGGSINEKNIYIFGKRFNF